jgi:CP family cyanate transporter-like MFS transporter
VAWQVTAYFGLQSLSFYAILSWLPSLYQDHGYSATAAGWLLSISAFVQAPVSLATPMLATRSRDQRWLVGVASVVASVALAGLTLAPGFLPYLWVALLGIGQGASFPLALTFVVLRTRTTQQAAELSAMAQTVGYLIAAIGPLVVGALRDASGSWVPPMALLLGLMAPQFVSGMAGACPRFVTAP